MSRPVSIPDEKDKTSSEQPSMIGAHLSYVQGAVSSALGYETGEQTKQDAVKEMREARDTKDVPTQSNVLGTIENAAGKLTGCEGMENEGASRKTTATGGSEEAHRTG